MSSIRPISFPPATPTPAYTPPSGPSRVEPASTDGPGDTFSYTPPPFPGYPSTPGFAPPEEGSPWNLNPLDTPWAPTLPPQEPSAPLGFGITNFNHLVLDQLLPNADRRQANRLAELARLKVETANLSPGALVVLDNFRSVPSLGIPGLFAQVEHHASHGQLVTRAARAVGFQGTVLEKDLSATHSGATDDLQKRVEGAEKRWQTSQDPAEIRSALTDWASARRAVVLRGKRDELELLHEGGVRDAVVNMSSGVSVADLAQQVFNDIPSGDDPVSASRRTQLYGQLEKAAGLTPEELRASCANSWQRMQQTVQGEVRKSDRTSLYVGEKAGYDFAVEQLAEQGNTIVVSASNGGRTEWSAPSGALPLTGAQIPDAVMRNDLATPHTVVVGALKNGTIAEYSSRYQGISFYADGDVQDGDTLSAGTSFAAPRVSAGFAGLKAAHPNASQQQLRQMAQLELSTEHVEDGHGSVPTLNLGLTHGFLFAD